MISNTFKKLPLPVLIIFGLLGIYFFYTLVSNPLVGFFFKGLVAIAPMFLKVCLGLLRYFAALFVLQLIFCKAIPNSLHRKMAWLAVIFLVHLLDSLHVFGEFNLLKPRQSFDYLLFELQLLSFYYVIIVLLVPKKIWGFLSSAFVALVSAISSGISIIPLIGTILGSIISALVTFAVIGTVILNLVAAALLRMEKALVKPVQTPGNPTQ